MFTVTANPTVPGFMARGNAPIIPKGMYDKINPSNQAIGTGPYKLVEFVPNDRVVLTRNPDFWKEYYQNVQGQIEKVNHLLKDRRPALMLSGWSRRAAFRRSSISTRMADSPSCPSRPCKS